MSLATRPLRASWTEVLAPRKANSLLGVVGATSDDNRRWAQRRSSSTAATLFGEAFGEPVSCLVLDTSSTGARIKPHFPRGGRFQSSKDMPKSFTMLCTIDRMAVDCKVAWCRGDEIGLKFISPARSLPKPPARPKHPGKGKGKR